MPPSKLPGPQEAPPGLQFVPTATINQDKKNIVFSGTGVSAGKANRAAMLALHLARAQLATLSL